ncbi:MAG TPA: transglutaminase family protein [Ruminococcus sp.]|nr:transglutaminase family protein [Ruminococcus sp.]
MKKINFSYETKLTFDDYVHYHSFALRVIPPETETQHILNCELDISPISTTQQTVDAFGNNVTSGYLASQHRFLDFSIKGTAETDLSKFRTDYLPCYLYQSDFTKPDENLLDFSRNCIQECKNAEISERVQYYSDKLSEIIMYQKNTTNAETTASQAFALKSGVCQDFAHILISILRMDDIPARYIAGLAFCDGETHAWVEYWNGSHWEGFDPANNCPVTEEYLVLAQGRDFGDASVSRGVMLGKYTKQLQLVRSALS